MTPGIEHLVLTDFRNYVHADLSPAPGINLISGRNAQGKTNLLESIYLLSTGRLLRSAKDGYGVREGQARAVVYGSLLGSKAEIQVELKPGVRKRAMVNGSGLPRASDLLGRLPSVTFSTQDLSIVTGEPADRRHFLDAELSQLLPSYLKHLGIYKRALEQRNALLRLARDQTVSNDIFDAWEAALALHGASLRVLRRDWIAEIEIWASASHHQLGMGEQLSMQYLAKDPAVTSVELESALKESRGLDIHRGSTGIGPHRDELEIEIAGRPAKHYGSQGQQRTAVIAIKLATLESAKQTFGAAPVLLLDDIFSDLDETRRSRLIEVAHGEGGQVFLTCTEPSQAGESIVKSAKVYRVNSGSIETA